MPAAPTLSADDVYALTPYILEPNNVVPNEFAADRDSLAKAKMPNRDAAQPPATMQPKLTPREAPLTDTPSTRPMLLSALALALLIAALAASPARAQSAAAEGQKVAFDRGKGNCLTCHVIKGGDLSGTIGPELKDIKSKYPDRNDLIGIVTDETKRNPQTVMPPFGRNRILTEKEISAVVDFLQTL